MKCLILNFNLKGNIQNMFNYVKTYNTDNLFDIFKDVDAILKGNSDTLSKTLNNCTYDDYTIKEDKGAKYVEIPVAGFSKDEITITVDEGILKVVAHQGEDTFSDLERPDITFTRKLDSADTKVTAEYQNGLLRLRFAEPEKKDTSRKVEII